MTNMYHTVKIHPEGRVLTLTHYLEGIDERLYRKESLLKDFLDNLNSQSIAKGELGGRCRWV